MLDFLPPVVYYVYMFSYSFIMATNYVICSATDVVPTGQRGGSTGLKYPWFDKSIPVGKGFFVERTYEEYEKDKGRPSIPKTLAKHNIAYKTYKARRGMVYGYMCERIK